MRQAGAFAALGVHALLLGLRVVPWHDGLLWPLLLAAAFALGGRGKWLYALIATALAIDLAYVWTVGFAGRNHVFAGIFALSDAEEYWADAERVMHGARMISGGARRPLFSAVFAGVLELVGNDIRRAHVAVLLFWAGAGAFAVNELLRTHGRRVAGIAFVLFVLFARRYIGFVQSEGLGAPLGAIAFGLVWRAAALEKGWETTYLGGLAVQAVALFARPGPMFLVVGLVVWAARRSDRPRALVAKSVGVLVLAYGFQTGVRLATSGVPAFADSLAIFYGLLHGEDSRYLFVQHAWIHDPPDPAQTGAVLRLFVHDIAAAPWLLVVAPLRCFAAWFYLPQGFFGVVWLNPDDRVLEHVAPGSAVAVWVRTLGLYSCANAIAMALSAAAFVGALIRALVKKARGDRDVLFFALGAILLNLPLLPPWITEGAQILATAFFWIVGAVAISLARATPVPAAGPLPRAGAITLGAVAVLILLPKLWPVRLGDACRGSDVLVDVDWRSSVTYAGDTDRVANVALVARNNPRFAEDLAATLATEQRLFPAYDGCREELVYVLDRERRAPLERRMWLRMRPLQQAPLVTIFSPP